MSFDEECRRELDPILEMRIDFLIERRTYHRFLLHLMKFFFAIRFELLLSSVILIELS